MKQIAGVLLAGLVAMAVSTAFGVERTFTNNNQSMSVAGNWNPNGVPGAGDTGIIGNGYTGSFTANLAGPPDAIVVRTNGAIKLANAVNMTTQHNIVMEGGTLATTANNNYGGTISLRYDSYILSQGANVTVTALLQNAGADAGCLIVTNSHTNLSGYVAIAGRDNTYSGGTIVYPGILQLNANATNSLGTGVTELKPGAILYVAANNAQQSRIVANGGRLKFSASFTLTATNTGRGDLEVETTGTVSVTASLAGMIEDYSISEPTRLVKTGGGLLNLRNTNTYSGGTLIKEGYVAFSGFNRALGQGNATVTNGAELRIGGTPATAYVADPTWPGYEVEILNGATVRLTSGSSVYTTNVIVRAGGNIKGNAASGGYASYDLVRIEGRTYLHRNKDGTTGAAYQRWFGVFRDGAVPGRLVYTGTGTNTTEIAAAQLYTGGTEVEDGGVDAFPLRLTGSGRLPDVGDVLIHAGAVVNFNSINDGVGGLGGAGSVILGNAAVTNYQGMSPGTNDLNPGTLTISTGTGTTGRIVLGSTSTNVFHISEPGNADQVVLQGIAGLTLGGTIKLEGAPTLNSGTYTLFDLNGGPLLGTMPTLLVPGYCSVSSFSTNSGDVVVTLERHVPGTLILLK